jgi:hypothetical protein
MAEEKLDATFFAFEKRDQRFVLTRGALGYFIGYALLCAIYLALVWATLPNLIAWYAGTMQAVLHGGEPSAPPAQVFGLIPYSILLGLAALVLFAAFEAACLRWLVRGESGGGLLGLTLGADAWRVVATYFVWLGLAIGFAMVCALFYVLVNIVANIGGPARIFAMLLGALAPLGFIALCIWGAVRFAPAAATSIAQRRFAFFEAPRVTKGHFWQIMGAFVILWVGYIVVVTIVGGIIRMPAQSAIAPVIADIMTGNAGDIGPRMLEAMSSPVYLISMGAYLVFSAILSTVLYIAMFGVNARAVLAANDAKPGTPS